MTFIVDFHKQPVKFLKSLNKNDSIRLIEKSKKILSENPVPHDAKSIVGEHGVFRIRIGSYRCLYRIDYDSKSVIIFKIDKRSRAY